MIKSIDGKPRTVKALQAGAFTDCEVPLSAGPHVLKVCYEARGLEQTGTVNVVHLYRCETDQELRLAAVAGAIYRIRFTIEPAFAARIEDVTSVESGIPAPPMANKSRQIPKAERTTKILVRVVGEGKPAFLSGETRNSWFKVSRMQQALRGARATQTEADGYFTAGFSVGDTIAIRNVATHDRLSFVCDTEVPVYEDLPGDRVLYLGDYQVESHSDGLRFNVSHDLAAARRFLEKYHPEDVPKLESPGFRLLRVPEPCMLLPVINRLRRAPAQ